MNDILHLKGPFEQIASKQKPGPPQLGAGASVTITHLEKLKKDLLAMYDYWEQQNLLSGALISVYYNKVAAKSNRIDGLFSYKGKRANESIVGSKFSKGDNKHIITHYILLEVLKNSIAILEKTIEVFQSEFHGMVDYTEFNNSKRFHNIDFQAYGIVKTTFQKVIVDSSYVEKFDIEINDFNAKSSSIITLYDIEENTQTLLGELGIKILNTRIIDNTTVLLDEKDFISLMQKAPYLVAMATENITKLAPSDFSKNVPILEMNIPNPINEPTIGVIDTLFDQRVYFHEWVEYHNLIDKNIPVEAEDYLHGTAVSSIVVDGPTLNPQLDDGCGRFRVRHFGIATNKAFNSFTIIRAIKEIITQNKDIKVWNLSLGSNEEVNENFISAEGAILDQIQFENDMIFVIAGTNKKSIESEKKIGAPADSINSMVVNSVGFNKQSAPYTRRGIVLSFFNKPDVSYYGGTSDAYISVCEPLGKASVSGTSYAAPWIARKLSYLIDILGFNREIAKAMLIDASIGWNPTSDISMLSMVGHGIVPVRIEDIVKTPDDEIKFVVSGISEKYDTFNYNFPVPIHNNEYPYIAKATLCYFPKCSRNQGVDYTNTELDLYFGRLKDDGKLFSINKNKQSIDDENSHLYEVDARRLYRKWDNIKHISDEVKQKPQGKKVYKNKMWGMSVKTKERLNEKDGSGIRFGVVVTLKEIKGVNRIEDFIQQCSLRNWLVNRINVENRIDIYQLASEEIEFEN